MRRVSSVCSAITSVAVLLGGMAVVAYGQSAEDEALGGGEFLENIIVNRPVAVRLRGEVRFTDDDEDILEEDDNYARFPAQMYQGEIKLFQRDRSTFSLSYEQWKNDQDLDRSSWSWKMWIPLSVRDVDNELHLTLRYRRRGGTEDLTDMDYWYVGLDKAFAGGLYAYVQYRHALEDGRSDGSQVYEYLSWKPTSRFRVGEQAAVTREEGRGKTGPWYVNLFGTLFVIPDTTALQLDARYYESTTDLTYQRYTASLYQRIGGRSFVRLNYRFYDDSEDLSSHAVGVKVKHYFSPRFTTHIGYRFYEHNEGPTLDTVYGGAGLIL